MVRNRYAVTGERIASVARNPCVWSQGVGPLRSKARLWIGAAYSLGAHSTVMALALWAWAAVHGTINGQAMPSEVAAMKARLSMIDSQLS